MNLKIPKKLLILISTTVLIFMSAIIEDRGLAILATQNDELIFPVSSGSEDGILLKIGLFSFVLTWLYAVVSLLSGARAYMLLLAYIANSLIFLFFVFLVSLDSSIIDAATFGDWLPLLALVIWALVFPVYGVLSVLECRK